MKVIDQIKKLDEKIQSMTFEEFIMATKPYKELEKRLKDAENALLETQLNIGKNEYIESYFEKYKEVKRE